MLDEVLTLFANRRDFVYLTVHQLEPIKLIFCFKLLNLKDFLKQTFRKREDILNYKQKQIYELLWEIFTIGLQSVLLG